MIQPQSNAIGFILRIEYKNQKITQHFIADDLDLDVGRLVGTLLNGIRSLWIQEGGSTDEDNRVVNKVQINKLKSRWRQLVKKDG